jgi:gamma-D-glutamyl-L-lysine dipeptidyl-peptidase
VKDRIERALASIAAQFSDKRRHVFQVTVASADQRAARLTGKVLEQSDLTELRRALSEMVPGIHIADTDVKVMRPAKSIVKVVATALTDLHQEPSFLAEMMTQVVNGWPLEVLEEQGDWCFVRQTDGYLGWAYKGYLADGSSPAVTHILAEPTTRIFSEPQENPTSLGRLLGGTAVSVTEARNEWSRIQPAGSMLSAGWIPTSDLRALASLPGPSEAARPQIVADARKMTGVYYLWGGSTAWGTDCSGLSQICHRLSGIKIPRDCDMQYKAGKPIEPPFRPGDLLFFYSGESEKRKVGHVGISTGGWNIIHSSRGRNGVFEEDVQANDRLRIGFAGARTFVGA